MADRVMTRAEWLAKKPANCEAPNCSPADPADSCCCGWMLLEPREDDAALAGPPPGEYCIVELFGHTTLVGRFSEVERFGTKMLALEPLFNQQILPPVFHGGAAIYRLTPCSAEVAWKRQPTQKYQLPPAIFATVPEALLPAPEPLQTFDEGDFDQDQDLL
jgi:hypothetical protein